MWLVTSKETAPMTDPWIAHRRRRRAAEAQKHFGRFDILFFLVCTIVGVDTIATVAQAAARPSPG